MTRAAVAIGILAICGEAIGAAGTRSTTWREEIELSDGSVTTIRRSAEAFTHGVPGSRNGPTIKWVIEVQNPLVKWIGGMGESPLTLDIVKGRAYLAVALLNGELCRKYDEPENGIVYFAWDGKNWVRVSASQFPGKKANLLANPWASTRRRDASGLVRNETKWRDYPANDRVNQPLEEIKTKRWMGMDACADLKEYERSRRLPSQK